MAKVEEQNIPDENSAWVNGKCKYVLDKPINVGGEDITEITLREPLAGDIIAAGNPVVLNLFGGSGPDVSVDQQKMGAMLSRLGNVAPSTINRMDTKDFIQAGYLLLPFFVPNI